MMHLLQFPNRHNDSSAMGNDTSICIKGLHFSASKSNEILSKLNSGNCVNLCISSSRVSQEFLQSIFLLGVRNASSLRKLQVNHMNVLSPIMINSMQREGFDGNQLLEHLDLSFNACQSETDFLFVSELISKCPSLTSISLTGNTISPTSMRILVKAIRRHPKLRILNLSSCQIGDESMNILSLCFKYNHNITHLDLRCNSISADGIDALLFAVKSGACQNIQKLDLSYNPIGELGVFALAGVIENNQLPSLTELSLNQVR